MGTEVSRCHIFFFREVLANPVKGLEISPKGVLPGIEAADWSSYDKLSVEELRARMMGLVDLLCSFWGGFHRPYLENVGESNFGSSN